MSSVISFADFSFANVWTASEHLERQNGWAARALSTGFVWNVEALAGRMVELTGEASLTAAFSLVLDAQVSGEPVAWICGRSSVFFGRDAAENGVDLGALPVVRLDGVGERMAAHAAARAADKLLRSGAFGLLVVDLGPRAQISMALQGRLLRLAEKHRTALVLLTETTAEEASLGPLISLRMEARRRKVGGESGFAFELCALKDKKRAPGWRVEEACYGPMGLR